ncbi:MAG TPA: sulfurtransferase [Sphingomicrobium sp.]|jgi:thiosulfate/3-mercaptopyruvate sulfurtransferase
MDSLVSTEWLAEHMGEVTVVDASWHMPATGRNGRAEFAQAHIPGARFLDIDEVRDTIHPAPHMLPDEASFATAMGRLGIGSDSAIVVYDNSPLRTAARGWFMLRHFGAREVAILDGGFQKWVAEGRETECGEPHAGDARFEAHERDELVTKQQLLTGSYPQLLDARGKARFEGSEADPRPGVAAGHIPGARNLPYAALYNEDGTFKPVDELRRLFDDAGVDPGQPFTATCGSGVTANSLIFAAHLLGNDDNRLYDGSWSEWGADPATPKATGPAS